MLSIPGRRRCPEDSQGEERDFVRVIEVELEVEGGAGRGEGRGAEMLF